MTAAPASFDVRTWSYGSPSADWGIRVAPDGTAAAGPWFVSGPCPVCLHPLLNRVGGTVMGIPGLQHAAAPSEDMNVVRVLVECNCGEVHPDREAESLGCGAFGYIVASWPTSVEADADQGTHDAARTIARATFRQEPAQLEDRNWTRMANELPRTALPGIRSSATKWAGSIAAIVGVFTVAGLVTGRDDISDLTRSFQWAVISILVLGLGATLTAMVYANSAATGRPQLIPLTGEGLRRATLREGDRAAGQLRSSQTLTVVGAVFVVMAVLVLWMGTEKGPDPSNLVQIEQPGVEPICGTLKSDGPRAVVIRIAGSQKDTQLDPAEVTRPFLDRDSC